MKVEMIDFDIYKVEKGTIYGRFWLLKYNDIGVEFEFKNGEIKFSYPFEGETEKKSFSRWLFKEKELYTQFILNYLNEINKINEIPSFRGEIIEERSYGQNDKYYIFNIQFDELPNNVILKFYPNTKHFKLFYKLSISINSDGDYPTAVYMEDILEYETIKRMWEPFRSKTKYRLKLLHILR